MEDMVETIIPPSKESLNKFLLSEWSLPRKVLRRYSKKQIESLLEWQYECLTSSKVLNEGNLIVCAPTGAGKTLVAELLALKCVLERQKKVIIIVPYVSVAQEKLDYLTSLFKKRIEVDGFMGNKYPKGGFSSVKIAVCTIERANGLVNDIVRAKDLANVGLVIVDELHMIVNEQRGFLLELLLTKFLYCRYKDSLRIQVVGMSLADVDMNLLSTWLDADIYKTKSRPIPLKEKVLLGTTFCDKDLNEITSNFHSKLVGRKRDISTICQKYLLEKHSILIFCPFKKECEVLAKFLATELQENMKTILDVPKLNSVYDQLSETPVGLDEALKKTIPNGIAYHHADLTFEERKIVENGFRQMHVKILVSTTTLSAGVNLPARLVIVTNPTYHYNEMQLDTLVYKQMVGRAGRKGFGTEGESILMCKADQKRSVELMLKSIPVIKSSFSSSKENLSMGEYLKKALLEVVTGGIVSTADEVVQYFCTTLFCIDLYNPIACMYDPVHDALKFLVNNNFISSEQNESDPSKEELNATVLGKATTYSALSPEDALSVSTTIENVVKNSFTLWNEVLIYLVIPQKILAEWPKTDWNICYSEWSKLPEDVKKVFQTLDVTESFLARAIQSQLICMPSQYQKFFMCMALQKLIQKEPIMEVTKKYGVKKGHLQRLWNTVANFTHMVAKFCKNSKSDQWKTFEPRLLQLHDVLSKESPSRDSVLKTARNTEPPHGASPPCKKLKLLVEDPLVPSLDCTQPRNDGQTCTSSFFNNHSEECDIVPSTPQLSDDDLADVLSMVKPAVTKWYDIGLQLKIHCSELDKIEKESSNEDACLRKMLVFWLRNGSNITWTALADAMGDNLVNRKDIKKNILKEKCQ